MSTLKELEEKFLPTIRPEDFFVILSHVTEREKVFLLAHPEYVLDTETELAFIALLRRRARHEPVALLIGSREFYGRRFTVTSKTLIPRPETEHLIECTLKRVRTLRQKDTSTPIEIVDVGTGSGNIIITLAQELATFHSLQYTGIDISQEALKTARLNAQTYFLESSTINFLESDLLKKYPLPKTNQVHLVVSANLPYLSEDLYHACPPDVKQYEPESALVSGKDGLDHYRRLLGELSERRTHYASLSLVFEMSPEQEYTLSALFCSFFPEAKLLIISDLSGKNRLIGATV